MQSGAETPGPRSASRCVEGRDEITRAALQFMLQDEIETHALVKLERA